MNKTNRKYLEFYKHLQSLPEFNGMEKCRNFNISNSAVSVLLKNNVIKKIRPGKYRWCGANPSQDMVIGVLRIIKENAKVYRKKQAPEKKPAQFEIGADSIPLIPVGTDHGIMTLDPPTPREAMSDEERTRRCISWLKSKGYKIMKPLTEFVEV